MPLTAYRTSDSDASSASVTLLQMAALMWGIAIVPIALLIGVVADTWTGRAFAMAALLTGVLPFGARMARERRSQRAKRWASTGAIVWAALTIAIVFRAPSGRLPATARVASQFRPERTAFARFGLTNLLPEEDQLLAGFTLMSFVDPLLSSSQAAELKRLTKEVYRELEQDAEFHEIGSAMQMTYGELTGLSLAGAHCYTYVPATLDRTKPAPVLIFFHGSGGPFKAYLWILAKVADRAGMILACPSGGLGNWMPPQTKDAFTFALEAAGRVAVPDHNRLHIAGLSNGGRAISQLAARHGASFASMIFISPVFDAEALGNATFHEQCRGRPLLVLTGARDNRVPLAYVESAVAQMTAAGARVELKSFPGADHFLIFSPRTEVIEMLTEWCGKRP